MMIRLIGDRYLLIMKAARRRELTQFEASRSTPVVNSEYSKSNQNGRQGQVSGLSGVMDVQCPSCSALRRKIENPAE